MRTNYSRGRAYEYKVIKEMEKNGWFCIRSAGSHSPVDIIALQKLKDETFAVKFLQIKTSIKFKEKTYFFEEIDTTGGKFFVKFLQFPTRLNKPKKHK
ncbi:MAG: hypothetical protein PHE73_08665 [Sulfurovaceae bacterium]|nr:hypothetical protein [Sulfurovaceae bacterium]